MYWEGTHIPSFPTIYTNLSATQLKLSLFLHTCKITMKNIDILNMNHTNHIELHTTTPLCMRKRTHTENAFKRQTAASNTGPYLNFYHGQNKHIQKSKVPFWKCTQGPCLCPCYRFLRKIWAVHFHFLSQEPLEVVKSIVQYSSSVIREKNYQKYVISTK